MRKRIYYVLLLGEKSVKFFDVRNEMIQTQKQGMFTKKKRRKRNIREEGMNRIAKISA